MPGFFETLMPLTPSRYFFKRPLGTAVRRLKLLDEPGAPELFQKVLVQKHTGMCPNSRLESTCEIAASMNPGRSGSSISPFLIQIPTLALIPEPCIQLHFHDSQRFSDLRSRSAE